MIYSGRFQTLTSQQSTKQVQTTLPLGNISGFSFVLNKLFSCDHRLHSVCFGCVQLYILTLWLAQANYPHNLYIRKQKTLLNEFCLLVLQQHKIKNNFCRINHFLMTWFHNSQFFCSFVFTFAILHFVSHIGRKKKDWIPDRKIFSASLISGRP